MDEALYAQVLLAVQVSHSQLASPADRAAAYAFSEEFKTRPDCALYAVAMYKNPGHDLPSTASAIELHTRQHFALHVLEHYVLTRWSALPVAEQVSLRNELMNLLLRAPPVVDNAQEPLFMREKKVALVAQIAKRQFPQRWPEFLPEMLQIWEQGSVEQIELVLMVLRSLAEDCVSSCFNTTIPPGRRKDILQGLNACAPELFPVVYRELEKRYTEYRSATAFSPTQTSSSTVIHAALQMLKEFLDWMPLDKPADPATNFIFVAVTLLGDPEFRIAAAECLEVYVSRTFGKENRAYMVSVISQIVEKVATLDLEELESDLESNLLFHKKVNDVLVAWGTSQLDLFVHENMTQEEVQLLNAILGNLCRLFAHPSLILTETQIVLWLSVLKNKTILKLGATFLDPVLEKLRQVAFDKYFKLGSPDREDGVACSCSAEEFDDHYEYTAFYGNFRGRLYALIRQLIALNATLPLQMLLERLSYVLSQHPRATDSVNKRGFCSESSTTYLYHEGITSLIDCVVKQLPQDALANSVNQQVLHSILQLVLSFDTQDPLLKYRQLFVLSAFSRYYVHDGNVLTTVFEMLFTNINFVLPGEDVHGEMSNETMNVRRRALASLVAICQTIPAHILPVLPVLCTKAQELFANDRVLDSEGVLLYEMLVLVSNSMESVDDRAAFLQQIIQEPLSQWTSSEMSLLVSSTEQLVTAIEAAAGDTESRKMLAKIVKTLTTLYGVAKRAEPSGEPQSAGRKEPFASSWPHVLPNLVSLIRSLHALQEPHIKDTIMKTSTACWLLSFSIDEIAQVLGGRHQLEEEEIAKLPVASKWSKWHKNVRDVAYHITGVAVTQTSFYTSPQVVTVFQNGLLSDLDLMEHRHLKSLIAYVFLPFVKHCPPALYTTLLEPVLNHLVTHITHRFAECYSKPLEEASGMHMKKSWSGLVVGVEEAKHDVVVDKTLMDLTRQVLEMMENMVDAKTVVGTDTDNPKHVRSPEDSRLRDFILMESGTLPYTVGTLLSQVISWKDTMSCRKAVALADKMVNTLHQDTRYHQFFGQDLFSSVLHSLLHEHPGHMKEDGLKWDLINLLRNIYCRLTLGLTPVMECKGFDPCNQPQKPDSVLCLYPREVLLSLPDVSVESIEALEAFLKEKHSMKSQKNAMKEFLEVPMLAIKQVSSSSGSCSPLAAGVMGGSTKQIHDLPEKLIINSKSQSGAGKWHQSQEVNLETNTLFSA